MTIGVQQLIILLPLALAAVAALALARPVSHERLTRFARRHGLQLTDDNRPLAVHYLATTRRWRTIGLVVSAAAAAGFAWRHDRQLHLNLLVMFAGWFVGAIVAEWRLNVSVAGPRRMASLVPRRARDYLTPRAMWAPIGLWAIVGGLAAAGLLVDPRIALAWGPLALIGVGAVIVAVARHVLNRAQPTASLDLVAVDDALRSRSLHVLAGSAVAIGGYLALIVIELLAEWGVWFDGGSLVPLLTIGLLVCPIVGVQIATAPARPMRATACEQPSPA